MIVPGRGEWAGLVALGFLLCGTIAYEIAAPGPPPSSQPARIAGSVREAPAGVDQPPGRYDAWLSGILARPLFNPDRKPIGSGNVRGLPRLTGIVVSGSRRVAIFAAPPGERPIVREAGTQIGVYDVKEVEETGVTVSGPGGTTVIRPLFDPSPPLPVVKPAPSLRPEPARVPAK
jgi:hypothetical protein